MNIYLFLYYFICAFSPLPVQHKGIGNYGREWRAIAQGQKKRLGFQITCYIYIFSMNKLLALTHTHTQKCITYMTSYILKRTSYRLIPLSL